MKRNIILLLTLSITSTLLFTGCGGGSSTTSTTTDDTRIDDTTTNDTTTDEPTTPTTSNVQVTITDSYQVESLGTANTINAAVSLGSTPKDLYLVLSNYAATSADSTITHNAKVVEVEAQSKSISPTSFTKNQSSSVHLNMYKTFHPNLVHYSLKQRRVNLKLKQ